MANRVIFNRHTGRALDNKTRAEEGILGSALYSKNGRDFGDRKI